MKKLLIIPILFLTSCINQKDVDNLREQYDNINSKLHDSRTELYDTEQSLKIAQDKLYAANAKLSGKKVKYIITFKLEQSHFTLDIDVHIKDRLNAITFDMPVDEDYYNKLKEGDEVVEDFRMGSLIMHGSFGHWEMSVEDKKIVAY
jgi:hypothetical protein